MTPEQLNGILDLYIDVGMFILILLTSGLILIGGVTIFMEKLR